MGKGLFFVGTGTDVGKTFVAGLFAKKLQDSGLSTAYFKAAMSGNPRDGNRQLLPQDALFVRRMASLSQPLATMCPYVYEPAVSPHLAARLSGREVEMTVVQREFLSLAARYGYVTVEGSGGIACPLRNDTRPLWLEDVIICLGLPCVLVSDAGLGAINAVVLTAEYLQHRHITVQGIILNRFHQGDALEEDNRQVCAARTGLPVIACIAPSARELPLSATAAAELYREVDKL